MPLTRRNHILVKVRVRPDTDRVVICQRTQARRQIFFVGHWRRLHQQRHNRNPSLKRGFDFYLDEVTRIVQALFTTAGFDPVSADHG
jgi:hypothetical protein